MSVEENKAIVRRWVEAWNQQDVAIVDELIPPEYVRHGNDAPEIHGQEAERQLLQMYLRAFPDLHFTVEDLIAEGDRVVVRYTVRGTQRGDLPGVPASNRAGEIAVMEEYRLANGKIVEQWVVADMLGLMQQLGAIPTGG